MKNIDVIQNFIKGIDGKTANLKAVGNKLINYTTVIAVMEDNKIFLNNERYSQTTSVIQNKIRRSVNENSFKTLIEVSANCLSKNKDREGLYILQSA